MLKNILILTILFSVSEVAYANTIVTDLNPPSAAQLSASVRCVIYEITTGQDDLRSSSGVRVTMHTEYTGSRGPVINDYSFTFSGTLNHGAYRSYTQCPSFGVEVPFLADLRYVNLDMYDHTGDIFQSPDNWNMDRITITVLFEDSSIPSYRVYEEIGQGGSDEGWVHRFKANDDGGQNRSGPLYDTQQFESWTPIL